MYHEGDMVEAITVPMTCIFQTTSLRAKLQITVLIVKKTVCLWHGEYRHTHVVQVTAQFETNC